jgi:WD domain, G-beta repeat
VVSGGEDGTVRLWEVATGEEICAWEAATGEEIPITITWESVIGEAATGKKKVRIPTPGYYAVSGIGRRNAWILVAFTPDGKAVAAANGGSIRLWDLLSGTTLSPLVGHRGRVRGVAFSPDSRVLASVSDDTTGLVWDLTYRAARPATKPPRPDVLATLWDDLVSSDATRAWRAIWTLTAIPAQSVPLLRDRLRAAPASPDPKQLAQLVADLDADEFQVRQKAHRKLEELGAVAEAALHKGLEGRPSLELRKRLEQLLELVEEQKRQKQMRVFSGEALRGVRAVVVLEKIGTPEARQILETLAAGGRESRLTQEAQAALYRLQGARRP